MGGLWSTVIRVYFVLEDLKVKLPELQLACSAATLTAYPCRNMPEINF